MKSPKIGLVLSGGGHRGVAHAGALKAMQERGIEVHSISGVSAGSIVGAMHAANYSPEDMLDLFKRIKLFTISNFARKGAGIVSTEAFHKILLEYFPTDSFQDLEKPLYVTVSDLITAKRVVFDRGRLIPAVLASSAVPGVFTPIKIGDHLYTDGGVLDNFPVKPLRNRVDEIFGVYVCPIKEMQITDFKRTIDVLNRALLLKMHSLSVNKFKECKVLVNPLELSAYHLFQSGQVDTIYQIGYEHACKVLDEYLEKTEKRG